MPTGPKPKRPRDSNQLAKSIVALATELQTGQQTIKKGGQPRASASKRVKSAK